MPHADALIELGAAWILLGQVNLYKRVNELLAELPGGEPPVHAWWALLPPPLDVVVGLRQVPNPNPSPSPNLNQVPNPNPNPDPNLNPRLNPNPNPDPNPNQVHFLAKYWAEVRGDEWQKDVVAEEYFPFISAPRFTLKTFARTPSMWFWFTKDWDDFDVDLLKEEAAPSQS